MIDLQQLHQSGAEVQGDHGEAWLRMPAVRDHRPGLLGDLCRLTAQVGRRITAMEFARHLAGEWPPAPAQQESTRPSEPKPAEQEPPMTIDPIIARIRALPTNQRAQLAAHCGVSKAALTYWIKVGRISSGREEQARQWLDAPPDEAPTVKESLKIGPGTDIAATLAERGTRYGDFTTHAKITQDIKRAMAQGNWSQLADDQRESLEMVAHKIGRILNGDPNYHDSWHDLVGYAKLVADRLAS